MRKKVLFAVLIFCLTLSACVSIKIVAVRHVVIALALTVSALMPVVAQDGSALTVSASSRLLQPGSVVLLTVRSSTPITTLTGQAFGRAVRFWPAAHSP